MELVLDGLLVVGVPVLGSLVVGAVVVGATLGLPGETVGKTVVGFPLVGLDVGDELGLDVGELEG